jgi:hypothetical protein
MKFRPFAEAREHVRRLGLKSQSEWRKKYCKSGHRPVDIPANPDNIYKGDWRSWGDFLGTGTINFKNIRISGISKSEKLGSFTETKKH